jgi:hypothetical protein
MTLLITLITEGQMVREPAICLKGLRKITKIFVPVDIYVSVLF